MLENPIKPAEAQKAIEEQRQRIAYLDRADRRELTARAEVETLYGRERVEELDDGTDGFFRGVIEIAMCASQVHPAATRAASAMLPSPPAET
jgi:hypothetical protein